MVGVHKKLENLSDDVTWFSRATELRAHFVYAESDISESVLRLILRGSRTTERPTPYLTFLEPFVGQDAGWADRVRMLDDARAVLAEELGARGKAIAPTSQAGAGAGSIGAFAARLLDFAHAAVEACAAPVIVLAPAMIESPARWAKELEMLVGQPALASIRWVIVVPDEASVARLVARLGASGLVSDCRTSPDDGLGPLAALLSNAETACPGAPPLAVLGMAWPRVAPPPRRHSSGTPLPAHVLTGEERARLSTRNKLMRAALALSSRMGPESIAHLRSASNELGAAGLRHEALLVRFIMATVVATLGQRKLACRELDTVTDDAMRLEEPAVAAQAASAKASLLAAACDTTGAIEAYAVAIQAARAAGEGAVPMLIDVLRAAGQLCLDTKQDARGVACLREALSVAEAGPPSAAAGAAEVARTLAAALRTRGMREQAAALEAHAERLEHRSLVDGEPAAVKGSA